jgi:chromosome segregation ATPase
MKFKAISLNRRTESPIKHVQNAPRFRSKHE